MIPIYQIFMKKSNIIDLTPLTETGYDIRTIQELLGHQNLQTTMIYAHVAKKNVLGVRSPLDK
jgi:integrase